MWDQAVKGNQNNTFNHVPGGSNVVWMDGSAQFVHVMNFHSDNLPANPGGVALGDTSVDPWEKLTEKDTRGGFPGRRR
jgi:prepilin-type processing-associated H-X9-DG protein